MRKIIAAINMSVDGYCDHTLASPDEEIHLHYANLIRNAGVALYGRITYQLMQYWQTVLKDPTGDKGMDDFAVAIDKVPKIVFSHTLKNTGWDSARLATRNLEEEITELKNQSGKDIFVCSPGLIAASAKLNLIDEYQLCIHPIIAGKGLVLFKDLEGRIDLELIKSKTFASGAIILYYKPIKK